MAQIDGTNGPDDISGTLGDDTIDPRGGDDVVHGNGGADAVADSSGNDIVYGGEGNDVLAVSRGSDLLHGEGGNDLFLLRPRITGELGSVRAYGGLGDDDFAVGAGTASQSLGLVVAYGGEGSDEFVVEVGGEGPRLLFGGAGVDGFAFSASALVHGGENPDYFRVDRYEFPINGQIVILDFKVGLDGDGLDLRPFLNFDTSWNGTSEPFSAGYLRLIQDGSDAVVQIYTGSGSTPFRDLVVLKDVQASSILPYNLAGTTPVVTSITVIEDDIITGGALRDFEMGYGGNDTFRPLGGNDWVNGGSGFDTLIYDSLSANYKLTPTPMGGWIVEDLRPGSPEGTDDLISVERLQFSDRSITLSHPNDLVADGVRNILRQSMSSTEIAVFVHDLALDMIYDGKSWAQVSNEIAERADSTTAVATLSYMFFTGSTPSSGGLDYLVSPDGPNPNNINSAYYQSFSLENRYINFAVNLGIVGEGKVAFLAEYGQLTPQATMKKVYEKIFGAAPSDQKVQSLLFDDVPNGTGGSYDRLNYFALYGGDGLEGIGTKAAMVGWLLAEAVKADLGVYALSNTAYLSDLADGASYAVDIIGQYGQPEFVFGG